MQRSTRDSSWSRANFVHVDDDGSARELTPGEAEYLALDFDGSDGNRPYIKASYEEQNGWGRLRGFLHRANLPATVTVQSCPSTVGVSQQPDVEIPEDEK